MEIITEHIDDLKGITDENKSEFAAKIAGYWEQWNDDRNGQISTAEEIMREVYLNQPKKKYQGELEWKNDIHFNTLYNIKRTKKSVLWSEMWSDPEQMFDVQGTNEQTEQTAKQQKAAIADSLKKMQIQRQFDKAADNLYDIGEMIFKTDWESRKKVVKRQRKDIGFLLMNLYRKMNGAGFNVSAKNMTEIEIPYYENARVESISPFMFVFDHSKFIPGNKNRWDSIIKIYKRFDTLENIKANKIYKITPEMEQELKGYKGDTETAENKELVDMRDLDSYGGQYAILYAHGDFTFNGKTYKNYIAEVLNGKYLIRFEENPLFINPFILCALEFDPYSKRGISPLKAVMDMCKAKQKMTNTAFDVQMLTANPVHFVNEDLFDASNLNKDGTLPFAPGKMIKVKADYNGGMPQPIKVSGDGIADLIGLLNQNIQDVASVSNFMYGNTTETKRTATELNLVDKGASSQASKELDIINQDLTIPMIQNVSELLAMFKDGAEYIYTKENGVNVELKITNAIRQAQYEYVYEDRNALEGRKAKFEQLFQLFQSVGNNEQLANMIDWREVITTAVEMLGFDNPEKFFNTEPESVNQLNDMLNSLPDDMKEQVAGTLANELQQYLQAMQMTQQQQQEPMPEQIPQNIEQMPPEEMAEEEMAV